MKCRIINYAVDLDYGDIDNVIDRMTEEGAFIRRPVGIVNKDYYFIYNNLSRNIGSNQHTYDGYSSPISTLGEIDYNQLYGATPWFRTDDYVKRYANYIDYASGTYGPLLSFFDKDPLSSTLMTVRTASIDRFSIFQASEGVVGANNDYLDTHTGMVNGQIAGKTLLRAAHENSARQRARDMGSITRDLYNYFSVSEESIETGALYDYFVIGRNGRWNSNPANEILDFRSGDPRFATEIINYTNRELDFAEELVNVGNYGEIGSLGIYSMLFDETTTETQEYIRRDLLRNRYYPSFESLSDVGSDITENTYLMYMLKDEGELVEDVLGRYIRHRFYTYETPSGVDGYGTLGVYYDGSGDGSAFFPTTVETSKYGTYVDIDGDSDAVDIISKTSVNLKEGLYDTLMARFHTPETAVSMDDQTQTAISRIYGMSRGRNLLAGRNNGTSSNGYSNPYCRVWTFHHQYSKYSDTIRPSGIIPGQVEEEGDYNWRHFRAAHRSPTGMTDDGILLYSDNGSTVSGGQRLLDKGVMDYNTGLVRITPSSDQETGNKFVDIRNCMFSIENLAWKGAYRRDTVFDEFGLSEDQMGPFGGRIMWFPPYNLSFDENTAANWDGTDFIGRGEKIYTYTNTERSGSLSFTILIDHPAILNYWDRRNEADSEGSVDDINSKEQQLLRFFAGCDILTARALNPKTMVIDTKKKTVEKSNVPRVAGRTEVTTFFIFFPHNYTGIDDREGATVNAMEYIFNGIGTSKTVDRSGNEVDFRAYLTTAWTLYGVPTGGYEIRSNEGISIVSDVTSSSDTVVYVDSVTSTAGNVHTNENGIKILRQKGNMEVTKEVEEKKKNGKTEKKTVTSTESKPKWYYRVDNRYKDVMMTDRDLVDTSGNGLNSDGYHSVEVQFKDIDAAGLCSAVEFLKAIEPGYNPGGVYSEDSVLELRNMLSTRKVKSVTVAGYAASNEGISGSTKDVASSRAATVKWWLRNELGKVYKLSGAFENIKWDDATSEEMSIGGISSVNDVNVKLKRCVRVDIHWETEESAPVQETQREVYGDVASATITASSDPSMSASLSNSLRVNPEVEPLDLDGVSPMDRIAAVGDHMYASYRYEEERKQAINARAAMINDGLNLTADMSGGVNIPTQPASQQEVSAWNSNVCRYDCESRFFNVLQKEDPVMFAKITEKIKYFNPAFHSITPEGFNARLTFLQQCMRQGPTVGATDTAGIRTANNLAFGRPPVCILRIGDFYYTKIVIDSLNISYDNGGKIQWDLNSEGIGVMPTMANIKLNFKFIGGSDLSGPISRLQNAVSFNYYANTGVYDNRAETAEFDDDGNMTNFKPFVPRIN